MIQTIQLAWISLVIEVSLIRVISFLRLKERKWRLTPVLTTALRTKPKMSLVLIILWVQLLMVAWPKLVVQLTPNIKHNKEIKNLNLKIKKIDSYKWK